MCNEIKSRNKHLMSLLLAITSLGNLELDKLVVIETKTWLLALNGKR